MSEKAVLIVKFGYGFISPKLEVQANKQGYTLGERKDHLEKLREAYNTLHINCVLTDKQSDEITKKIHRKVLNNLEYLSNLEGDAE